MKFHLGDTVFNKKTGKVGTIVEWYEDYDGDDESGPIYLVYPIIRYDDGTDDIVNEWYLEKVVTKDA